MADPKPSKPNDSTDLSVLDRLAAAEKALKERDEEVAGLKAEAERVAQSGGLKYSPKDQPFAGEGGGYEFEVTPILKDGDTEYAHLKARTVRACDESEALRWYCQVNEMKPGSGKALDPVKVRLGVKCIGRDRADAIMQQKQVSALRKKVESGMALSPADLELLSKCENEIYGFGS